MSSYHLDFSLPFVLEWTVKMRPTPETTTSHTDKDEMSETFEMLFENFQTICTIRKHHFGRLLSGSFHSSMTNITRN